MRALITEHQFEHFADRYRQAVPGIELLVMAPDGSITLDGTPVDPSTADEEVAFGSTDLFDTAHDDRGQARDFFVHALKSTTLRWFHVAAAGVDDPAFGMLLDNGVRVTTSHHTAIPISEYVLAQVLRARLPLAALDAQRAERAWRGAEWDEIAGSRWLVIGMGSIGTEVARRAQAFGARVTGVRRSPTGHEPVDRMIGPAEILAEVGDHDVIVLAVPATPRHHRDGRRRLPRRAGTGSPPGERGPRCAHRRGCPPLVAGRRTPRHRGARRDRHRTPSARALALGPPPRGADAPHLGRRPPAARPGG